MSPPGVYIRTGTIIRSFKKIGGKIINEVYDRERSLIPPTRKITRQNLDIINLICYYWGVPRKSKSSENWRRKVTDLRLDPGGEEVMVAELPKGTGIIIKALPKKWQGFFISKRVGPA